MLTQSSTSNLPEIWKTFADVQMQACADWLALTQETWARCALTRNPLEWMSTASLMLPECVSSAMQYFKNVSDAANACRDLAGGVGAAPAAALPLFAPGAAVGPAGVVPVEDQHPARSRTSRVMPEVVVDRSETSGSSLSNQDRA
ncbi:hypothetical protein [Paraburkholderia sp. EG304]|uniref:hypothetical protein n=1 Tax=Paraburkholderia sp. EG304 TaxID=3237015 RepID=UPI00397E5FFA